MKEFQLPIQIRWSDLDPNFHVRHSVFYDWGALCRVAFLYSGGLSTELMTSLNFGPIVFREEAVFRKEILLEDKVTIRLQLLKSKKDYSRWTIRHPIVKNGDILSTMLTVDGAWIDTAKRKLCLPPPEAIAAFEKMYKPEEFTWED